MCAKSNLIQDLLRCHHIALATVLYNGPFFHHNSSPATFAKRAPVSPPQLRPGHLREMCPCPPCSLAPPWVILISPHPLPASPLLEEVFTDPDTMLGSSLADA